MCVCVSEWNQCSRYLPLCFSHTEHPPTHTHTYIRYTHTHTVHTHVQYTHKHTPTESLTNYVPWQQIGKSRFMFRDKHTHTALLYPQGSTHTHTVTHLIYTHWLIFDMHLLISDIHSLTHNLQAWRRTLGLERTGLERLGQD